MVKKILGGIALIACGIFMISVADEYVYKLFYVIPIDFRIIGGLCIVAAIWSIIQAVREGKGASSSSKTSKPSKAAASKPAAQQPRPAAAPQQPRPAAAPQQPRPAAAPQQSRPAAAQSAAARPQAQAGSQDMANKMREEKLKKAEYAKVNLDALELQFNGNTANTQLLPALMHAYDELLRSQGPYTFDNFQYRFYAALRAIHKEEQFGASSSTRRFWVVHSAVHGGIAAGKTKDLAQLEAALQMLERAQDFRPETNRPVDEQYMNMAIPAVRCWNAYLVAKLSAQRGDYRRASSALWDANRLFPMQGSLRMCHLNPHLPEQTQVVLTRQQLEALHNQLSTMNRY